jgi:23S rRNA pseudouridine955/2504/2580 synthase
MPGIESATVSRDEDGIRMDRWFKRHFPEVPHGLLEKLLRTGQVRLDGKRAGSGDRLSWGQIIRLPPQVHNINTPVDNESTESQTVDPHLSEQERIFIEGLVIYADQSVYVLNKPPGLPTQGGTGITRHVDGLLEHLTQGKNQRPRLVHRLDRDTSGVLVVARTVPAATSLGNSLAHRDAMKIYWALVKGMPKQARGTIKAMIAKEAGHGPHGRDEKMVISDEDNEEAKVAITDYVVVDRAGDKYSWLALRPLTGRTHQIRVHLASIGHPIIGDFKYGGKAARGKGEIPDKLHLHARYIDIAHPDSQRLRVTAPVPAHMRKSFMFLGFDPEMEENPFAPKKKP